MGYKVKSVEDPNFVKNIATPVHALRAGGDIFVTYIYIIHNTHSAIRGARAIVLIGRRSSKENRFYDKVCHGDCKKAHSPKGNIGTESPRLGGHRDYYGRFSFDDGACLFDFGCNGSHDILNPRVDSVNFAAICDLCQVGGVVDKDIQHYFIHSHTRNKKNLMSRVDLRRVFEKELEVPIPNSPLSLKNSWWGNEIFSFY